jgi:hypothetical protein
MAQRIDITMDQGATFEFSFNVNDANGSVLDLSNYTARAELRRHYTSTNSVSFSANIEANTIFLRLTSNQTSNIVSGRYVYDCEIVDDDGLVTRAIEGVLNVSPEVTR